MFAHAVGKTGTHVVQKQIRIGLNGLAAKFGKGMVRTGRELWRVAPGARSGEKKLLAPNGLGVRQVTSRANAKRGNVACHIRQLSGVEFGICGEGLSVECCERRRRHAHVAVKRVGDLVTESRLRGLIAKATQTRLNASE